MSESPSRTQLQAEIEILQMQLRQAQSQLAYINKFYTVELNTIKDLMGILTESAHLDQGIQAILVNLRELFPYDLAGLFLLAKRSNLLDRLVQTASPAIRSFPDDHPLVTAMEISDGPMISSDISMDQRFDDWEEMQPIRSWMGLPLRIGDALIGFLSLGSLQTGVYQERDAAWVQSFITPLSEMVEIALKPEKPIRMAGSLDIISRLTSALGQVGSQEEICKAILHQVERIFGQGEGAFLFPDHQSKNLTLVYSMNEGWKGFTHSRGDDIIWGAFDSGKTAFLENITEYNNDYSQNFFKEVFSGNTSALIVPLTAENSAFAILLIIFRQHISLSAEDYLLVEAIAQMTSSTLHRLFTLEALESQLSEERNRLIEQTEQAAVLEERQRLARELHDSVTQLIYSQVLFAGAGLKVLRNGDQQLSQEYLQRIHQVAQQALKEMRLLVFELRPHEWLDDGLVAALQRRLDAVERRSDLRVKFEMNGRIELDETTEIALYYIAMEALNNILKHSNASEISLSIQGADDGFMMEVRDNGCGFDLSQKQHGGGMGLTSMQERAAAVDGKLDLITSPGAGTKLVIRINGGT